MSVFFDFGFSLSSFSVVFISINFDAVKIVFFNKSQYKLIDLLASSLPGIGKCMLVGSELVSKIATIGILSF